MKLEAPEGLILLTPAVSASMRTRVPAPGFLTLGMLLQVLETGSGEGGRDLKWPYNREQTKVNRRLGHTRRATAQDL
ncbi:hypothetical protein AB1N83_011097 [Pleurotus pulmonarius]